MAIPELDRTRMPPRIARLERDERGYPIPWFAYRDPETDKPDFRILQPGKLGHAHNKGLCMVCGQPRGRMMAFPLGPMCVISGTNSEPPSHRDCVEYAMRVCPFLARPNMRRQTVGLPEDHWTPGMAIARNPGAVAVWITRSYGVFRSSSTVPGTEGVLFQVGPPEEVLWYCQGRPATGDEVWASVRSGLPALAAAAACQKGGVAALKREIARAMPHMPMPSDAIDVAGLLRDALCEPPPANVASMLARAKEMGLTNQA